MKNKFSIFNFQRRSRKLRLFSIKLQSGQVIVLLLLLMLVALSVGLALTQKSVTDVTTSTRTEQSQRAFSAAEAGIEKALGGTLAPGQELSLDNSSRAIVNSTALLPAPNSGVAIEYPPIGRETTAQFLLTGYNSSTLDLYFGNENTTTTDKPAVEVKIVMKSNNKFYSKTYYYDSDSARAPSSNNFADVSGNCNSISPFETTTILGPGRKFYCKQQNINIPDLGGSGGNCPNSTAPYNCELILARVRFLYINGNHNLALARTLAANFPPQVQIYNSTGTAGESQKQIQAFKVIDVVPPWFDFAVFSIDKIQK